MGSMYPYPVPQVAAPESPAEKHVRANAIVMLVMAFLLFCGIGSVVMNVAMFFHEHPHFLDASASDFQRGEQIGQLTAYGAAALWSVSGVIWAPLNAYGLFKRKPWARMSSLLYWGIQIASCCCFPFGAYGMWSLLRADVKQLFGR